MQKETEITLKNAKEELTKLMSRLNKKDQERLISYFIRKWIPVGDTYLNDLEYVHQKNGIDNSIFLLNSIAADIRKQVPFNSVLPSEHITAPKIGENSDCESNVTVHLDEFLYDDDDVDKLIEEGLIQRQYCSDCGSRNIKPLIFISHSMSRDSLYYIFNTRLPALETKTILDIGSRLGAVLYGAYAYTNAPTIIGIEMNEELCNLQWHIIEQYKMHDRIEILHKRVEDAPEIVKQSDVIVINNPFEFYLSQYAQIKIWKFLNENITKGTILVTKPSMEIMLKHLNTGITVEKWLQPFQDYCTDNKDLGQLSCSISNDSDKYSDIAFYKVI